MSSSSVHDRIDQLRDFGRNIHNEEEDQSLFYQYVEERLTLEEIVEVVENVIDLPDGSEILNYLFAGLRDLPSTRKKRFVIVKSVLSHLQGNLQIANKQAVSLTSRVSMELDKLESKQLVKLCELCVEFVRTAVEDKSTIISWADFFPNALNLLNEVRELEYNGASMSGSKCKNEILLSLCSLDWTSIITPLTKALAETELTSDEHERIVRKACGSFVRLKPQELPPLAHQLLTLCKEQHTILLFMTMREYFASRMQWRENIPENVNAIESCDKTDILEAESTILCHINEFARLSRVSSIVKICKAMTHAPDMALDPFTVAVLLSLSCITTYESQVMDILRTMLVQAIVESNRKQESAWFQKTIVGSVDVDQLFIHLIRSKPGSQDTVMKGIMNLGFTLLAVPAPKGRDQIARRLWRLGRYIIVLLCHKHSQVTKYALTTLKDRIISGSATQYTDCLYQLCDVVTMSVLNQLPIVVSILEFIHQLPGPIGTRIITALIPLIKISSKLRDNLVLVLRKTLFSKNVEHRQTAVTGFLQLLKYLKVHGLTALSQNPLSQSTQLQGASIFSQISMEILTQNTSSQARPNVNEAICLEVLGVLKRCLSQQSSVKIVLYKGLGSAVDANPELCCTVLDVMLDHFSQFYEPDETMPCAIIFEKCVLMRDADAILVEPVGELLMLMQDVVLKVAASTDEETNRTVRKVTDILSSVTERFSHCDLNHLTLDESVNLVDVLPENYKTRLIVKQILDVCEALIAYLVNSANAESTNEHARKLIAIHKLYELVLDYSKVADKPGKKKDGEDGKKDKKEQKKDKDKTIAAPKKVVFKYSETILNIKSISKLILLFVEPDVDFASDEMINELKPRRGIFRYVSLALLDLVSRIKSQIQEEQRSSTLFTELTSVAKILFEGCLRNYERVILYESSAEINLIECSHKIFEIIATRYKGQLQEFLETVVGTSKELSLNKKLTEYLKVYQSPLSDFLEEEQEENTEDSLDKDPNATATYNALLNAFATIALAYSTEDRITEKCVQWVINVAENRKFKNANNAKVWITLMLTLIRKYKSDTQFADNLVTQLSNMFSQLDSESSVENAREPLLIVQEETKITALLSVCALVTSYIDDIEVTLSHMKAEAAITPFMKSQNEDIPTALTLKEQAICLHMAHITVLTQAISTFSTPPGAPMENVLKLMTRTYNVLCALAKYFIMRSTADNPVYQHTQFKKCVKIAGSQLFKSMSQFILYVEMYDMDKEISSSKLDSPLRIIPKLISETENFSKFVTTLSKKCKDDSLKNKLKLTATRDFKLSIRKLHAVIENQDKNGNVSETTLAERSANVTNGDAEHTNVEIDGTARPSQVRKRKMPRKTGGKSKKPYFRPAGNVDTS